MKTMPHTTPTRSRRGRRWLAVCLTGAICTVGVLAAAGPGVVVDRVEQSLHEVFDRGQDPASIDTDGDGLTDVTERAGWTTEDLGTFRTSPKKADTDGDGLPDGMEAGDPVNDSQGERAYVGVSDPTRADTDDDGIDDGDEYFLAMSPTLSDTDADGLSDLDEVNFGSDPTEANVDGDSYTDAEEREHNSDPLAYDLTSAQKVAATIAGFGFGDWEWGAQHVGRMNDTELESPEYLGGELVSGYVVIGDLRDAVADAGTLDVVGVVISLIALAPGAGDAVKTVAKLAKFATRGERAERAAFDVVERLPWTTAMKRKVLDKVFARSMHHTRLPVSFRDPPDAPRNNVVYKSVARPGCRAYVGISNDFQKRVGQHKRAGRCIEPEIIHGMTGLTRNTARAVEEYCIRKGGIGKNSGGLANQRASINANTPFMEDILAFAKNLLTTRGGTCPL